MCGRYVRKGDKQKISEAFRAEPNPAELPMPGCGLQHCTDDLPADYSRERGNR